MLDAFIIERIKQQQIRHRESQVPLHIQVPEQAPSYRKEELEQEKRDDRGVAIIDFSI
ncbi:MAG: hypothetical protein ACOZNI_17165 [Myxococcota bacterium]